MGVRGGRDDIVAECVLLLVLGRVSKVKMQSG